MELNDMFNLEGKTIYIIHSHDKAKTNMNECIMFPTKVINVEPGLFADTYIINSGLSSNHVILGSNFNKSWFTDMIKANNKIKKLNKIFTSTINSYYAKIDKELEKEE